ncbi:hypothetical protein PVA45_01650 [Entomospira entomophila]|uniref:Phosphoenolpyruvate carboxykinase n=1 Tax=Entomospira entomophila TaxID=2719988 RepID=A0A968KSC8_9SPIO|nr:phosphoenolpyruvate carboxykinase [Entomospira entomophilus]NIZ40217.1 phosphoenolpyruvate carboxykinase [Entomospira entomophilus]WDI35776.1 hypothetical protein PVA45_01650 [Entomospira entomophilus]
MPIDLPPFSLTMTNVICNFDKEYCHHPSDVYTSQSFYRVVSHHINHIKETHQYLYRRLQLLKEHILTLEISSKGGQQPLADTVVWIIQYLFHNAQSRPRIPHKLADHSTTLYTFVESLFQYWRSLERYAITKNPDDNKFIEAQFHFQNLILHCYSSTQQELSPTTSGVHHQRIAGVNAGIIITHLASLKLPDVYHFLHEVPIITSISLTPPLIVYPQRNTREGIFPESHYNPLTQKKLHLEHFLCYPAKVGKYLALVYFQTDFMAMGISLANLFALASIEEIEEREPDLVYIYGVHDGAKETLFYHDQDHDIMIGYASYHPDIDYFGYMKKMLLTLHNVKGLNSGGLPLHGAMAAITLNDSITKYVIMIGDSGAGKSETLEALHHIKDSSITSIKIIFDDMGIIYNEGGQIKAYGTEIGAFVRLDDLETGYAYQEIDHAIFMNPQRHNARIVIPVATYEEIIRGYPVDLFLYANNYNTNDDQILEIITDIEEAKAIFIEGARMAKGTTQEVGLVTSYFSNPFGPLQRKEQTDHLIQRYFQVMQQNDIMTGELKTRLGVPGFETIGPREAALALLMYLQNSHNS